jgi:hypothetical protein
MKRIIFSLLLLVVLPCETALAQNTALVRDMSPTGMSVLESMKEQVSNHEDFITVLAVSKPLETLLNTPTKLTDLILEISDLAVGPDDWSAYAGAIKQGIVNEGFYNVLCKNLQLIALPIRTKPSQFNKADKFYIEQFFNSTCPTYTL